MVNIPTLLRSNRIIQDNDPTNKDPSYPLLAFIKRLFCCFHESSNTLNVEYKSKKLRQNSVSRFDLNFKNHEFKIDEECLEELSKILNNIESGMLPELLNIVKSISKKSDVIIGFRPVSKFASSWTRKEFPTKPFLIKDKSSKYGIDAGLVRAKEGSTKTSEYLKNPVTVKSYCYVFEEDRVKEVLTNPEFFNIDKNSIQLMNKTANITEILKKEKIFYQINTNLSSGNEKIYQILEKDSTNKTWRLYETAVNNNNHLDDFDPEKEKKTVFFWAYCETKLGGFSKPFTADYDLLTTGFNTEFIENEEILKRPVDITQEEKNSKDEHLTKGNIHKALENLIQTINGATYKLLSEKVRSQVHHNDEAGNPFASNDEGALFPAVFTFPKFEENLLSEINESLESKIQKSIENEVMVCSGFKDFTALVNTFKENAPKYKIDVNPKWKSSMEILS